jgi:glycosyltransferase involved in cell wall biosynthesis
MAEELISPAGLTSGRLDVDKCASRLPRICYLANAGSSHTAKWVNHFCARGHEVHVISFEDPRGITDRAFVHKLRARTSSNLRYFTASGQVKRIIEQIQPSLLNAHYAAGYGTLGRLSRFHPYILSVWGSDVFDVPLKSLLHRLLIKRNLASADEIGSSNHQVHEPKEFVIGTVKSLEEKYGIEYLIRCFALLVAKYRGARKLRLVIAGDGCLRGKLSRLAKECGVEELTEFLGAVPHDRVPEVLNRFSVFVALSILDSESFGVAVVEASACGLPVVISDVPGMGEVVTDGITGLIVPRRDALAAAEAISTLIENERVRQEMGLAGREFVMKNYEWSENAGRMERLYRFVLERCGAPTHSRGELTRLNC